MVFGKYLSAPHRPGVASGRRIFLRNKVFKHALSGLMMNISIHQIKKQSSKTGSVKFNCCAYFGSGVLSRNSAGNKLFLGTAEVLKVSLTVLFACAQQKARGQCCAQGCFHHWSSHGSTVSTEKLYQMRDLRNICRRTCFSATLEPTPLFFTHAL